MKDKELEEQTSDQLAQQLIDELKSKGMVIVEREEMIDLIAQERRKAKIEVLEKLKDTIKMHTVPEGRGLITRSYLNNSIDFMLAELKEDKE